MRCIGISGEFHNPRAVNWWQSKPVSGGSQHLLCRVFSRPVWLNNATREAQYHVSRPFRASEPDPDLPAVPGRVPYHANDRELIEDSSDRQERPINSNDGFQQLSRGSIAEQ
jgi:hypothetical protein